VALQELIREVKQLCMPLPQEEEEEVRRRREEEEVVVVVVTPLNGWGW